MFLDGEKTDDLLLQGSVSTTGMRKEGHVTRWGQGWREATEATHVWAVGNEWSAGGKKCEGRQGHSNFPCFMDVASCKCAIVFSIAKGS